VTNRDLARLLLLYPDTPVCVAVGGVLREVERVRVVGHARYFPPIEEGIFAVGPAVIVEALPDAAQRVGETDRA
jgi:hypothetical protein